MDIKALSLVALIGVAPLALIVIIALLRGYTISVHMHRGRRRGGDDE
jgi:hypothetical protein